MPSYEHLSINQLDKEAFDWLKSVLDVIETLDVNAYVAMMVDDVEVRMADGRQVKGRADAKNALGELFGTLKALEHQDINLYGRMHHVVHECRVAVTTTDGDDSTSLQTVWLDADENGMITSARIYD